MLLIGGEDFDEFKTEIKLYVGDTNRCVGVMVRDDQLAESDERFFVIIEETGGFAEVIILDNDGN